VVSIVLDRLSLEQLPLKITLITLIRWNEFSLVVVVVVSLTITRRVIDIDLLAERSLQLCVARARAEFSSLDFPMLDLAIARRTVAPKLVQSQSADCRDVADNNNLDRRSSLRFAALYTAVNTVTISNKCYSQLVVPSYSGEFVVR